MSAPTGPTASPQWTVPVWWKGTDTYTPQDFAMTSAANPLPVTIAGGIVAGDATAANQATEIAIFGTAGTTPPVLPGTSTGLVGYAQLIHADLTRVPGVTVPTVANTPNTAMVTSTATKFWTAAATGKGSMLALNTGVVTCYIGATNAVTNSGAGIGFPLLAGAGKDLDPRLDWWGFAVGTPTIAVLEVQ